MPKNIDWKDLVCEEASTFSITTKVDCGAPAAALVWHQRDRRAYTMCLMCADHNLRNRGGILLGTTDIDLLHRYASPVVVEPQTKKTEPKTTSILCMDCNKPIFECTCKFFAEPQPDLQTAKDKIIAIQEDILSKAHKKMTDKPQPISTTSDRNIKHKVTGSHMTIQKGKPQPEHCKLGHDWKCTECPEFISDVSDNLSHTQRCMHEIQAEPEPTCPDCGYPHYCSKGHTMPLNGYCDLMACKDYTPDAGNVCAYLDTTEPDSRQAEKHCLMGHTLPLDMDSSDQCRGGCGDYYPDDRGDCTNLRQSTPTEQMPLKSCLTNIWHESNEINVEIAKRRWITEGRGCYDYSDDRYRDETGLAFNEIEVRIAKLQISLKAIDAVLEGK